MERRRTAGTKPILVGITGRDREGERGEETREERLELEPGVDAEKERQPEIPDPEEPPLSSNCHKWCVHA